MEEKKTKKQIYEEAIATIPLMENFSVPPGFPIPLKNTVYIKQLTGEEGENVHKTEAGILILENSSAANVIVPHTGVVMAVGIDCSDYLVPGQKIIYNKYADVTIRIFGQEYIRLNEATDVYGILPPDSWVREGVKDDRWLFREKRKKEFADYEGRKERHDANEKDRLTEAKKGKSNVIIMPGTGGDA